jgi:hypothetical protein
VACITFASDAHTTDAWPATSTKQWQWPSTSASAKVVTPRTFGPLIVLSSGSAIDAFGRRVCRRVVARLGCLPTLEY